MKTRNLAVALFSCALLSTAYVSNEMEKIATLDSKTSRSVASEAEGAINPAGDNVVSNSSQEESVPFYLAWGDKVSSVASGFNIIDINFSVRPSELKKQLDDLTSKFSTLEGKKAEVEKALKSEKKKAKELQEMLDLTNKHTGEMVGSLLDDRDALEAKNKEQADLLKRTNEETSRMVNSLLDERDVLESDVQQLKAQKEKIAQALEAQTQVVNELQMALAQYESIEEKIDALKKAIAELTKENTELKDENQKLTCMLEKQNDLEEQIKKLTADKEDILAKLNEKLEASEEEAVAEENKEGNKEEEKVAEENKEESKEEEKVAEENKEEEKVAEENKEEEKVAEENKEEEKVAEDKKDEEDKVSDSERMMQIVEAYFSYQSQIQQQNDMYRLQMSLQGQRNQRALMTDMTTFSGGGSFLNSQMNMLRDIEDMRMRSRMYDNYRFDRGGFFGQDRYDSFPRRDYYQDDYRGLNTGRRMSFHDQYIKDQPMEYTPQTALPVSSFNPDRAFNFGLNASPNFAETQSWQPSSVSFN